MAQPRTDDAGSTPESVAPGKTRSSVEGRFPCALSFDACKRYSFAMNASAPVTNSPEKLRLRVEDFELLEEGGAFADRSKAELIDGEITIEWLDVETTDLLG